MKSIWELLSDDHRWIVRLVVFTAAALAVFVAPTHAVNLVTNGSFESPGVQGLFDTYFGVDAVSLAGWVVDEAGTSINHVNAQWNDADGFQSVDLNGIVASSVYQDLTTVVTQQYLIRFALAGNPEGYADKRMEVLWDGAQIADVTFTQAGHDPINMGWTYYELIATAADSSTRLTFKSLTGAMTGDGGEQTWYGPVIDDVSVNAVPEPNSAILMLVGLLLFATGRRASL